MVRAFRRAVFRNVAGACRPPAERRGGGRAAQSPERARHERLHLRLANGIRPTLEDGALCARGTGGLRPKCRVVDTACHERSIQRQARFDYAIGLRAFSIGPSRLSLSHSRTMPEVPMGAKASRTPLKGF